MPTKGGFMAGFGMQFNTKIAQHQKLSPQMQFRQKILTMGNLELYQQINEALETNPAMEEVVKTSEVKKESGAVSELPDSLLWTKSSSFDAEKSDKYLAFLEAQPNTQETLQQHLLNQLTVMKLSREEEELCTKIIGNLDGKGFNILAPVSFLKEQNAPDSQILLETCLNIVQQMDPVGCATDSQLDTLLVQARIKVKEMGIPQDLALFILDGRLSLIEGLKIPAIKSQLLNLIKSGIPVPQPVTEDTIAKAIRFIQTLDPIPGRQYGDDPALYIYPDIIIKKLSLQENSAEAELTNLKTAPTKEDFRDKAGSLLVSLTTGLYPRFTVSEDFQKEIKNTTDKKTKEFLSSSVNQAKELQAAIQFREENIGALARILAEIQKDFFFNGPRYLRPLKMKEVAEILGVHESTVSRLANNKYLKCDWGLFEIKYFFSNSVSGSFTEKTGRPSNRKDVQKGASLNSEATTASDYTSFAADSPDTVPAFKSGSDSLPDSVSDRVPKRIPELVPKRIPGPEPRSQESIKFELAQIIQRRRVEQPDSKPLSDQKLADLLYEQTGIKIARRTVAKYRHSLNIESSYTRK